jgi:hypothetical protein
MVPWIPFGLEQEGLAVARGYKTVGRGLKVRPEKLLDGV